MKTPVPSPSRKVTQSADPRVWPFLLPRGKVEAPSHEEAGPPKHASLAGGTMRKSWAVLTALKGSRRGRAVRSLLLRAQLSLGLAPRRCPSPPRKPSAEERGSAPAGSLHMPDMPCEPLGDWSPRSRPSGAGTSPCCSAWPPRCPRQRAGSAARGGQGPGACCSPAPRLPTTGPRADHGEPRGASACSSEAPGRTLVLISYNK